MSVTQYIGARYVPLFADPLTWDITKAYEALTIVYYQGNSFTSRQAVPAGIDITNNDYWALTGNYNAQVEQYRAEVQTFDGRITANTSSNTAQDAQLAGTTSSGLKTLIESNAADIDALEGQMAGTSTSGLKGLIDANTEDIATLEGQMGGTSTSGLKELIDGVSDTLLEVIEYDGSIGARNDACTLVKSSGFTALCDTGSVVDASLINAWLTGQIGAGSKLDLLVLTHYHNDHASNYASILENWCDDNTVIWEQMAPSSSNDEYSQYSSMHASVVSACSTLGLQSPVVPLNGHAYSFGDMGVTAYNTSGANVSAYDTQSWANNGNYQTRTSSLNNYSLIVRFDYKGSSYLETADVECMAQRFNAQYMSPVTLMRVPHHLVNKMGYEEFFDRCSPSLYIVSDNVHDTESPDVADWRASYMWRYLAYNQIATNVMINETSDVYIAMRNGVIMDARGEFIDKDYNPGASVTGFLTLYAAFPPDVWYENPYYVHELTIAELWTLKTHMIGCPSWLYNIGNGSSSALLGSAAIIQEAKDLFTACGFSVGTARILLDMMGERPAFIVSNRDNNNCRIEIGQSYATDPTQWNCVPLNNKRIISITGNFSDGASIANETNYSALLKANAIDCLLDTGSDVHLPLHRRGASPSSSQNFEGYFLSPTSSLLYCVKLSSSGVLNNYRVNLVDGSITSPYTVKSLTTIY